jgi:hypothetical protein
MNGYKIKYRKMQKVKTIIPAIALVGAAILASSPALAQETNEYQNGFGDNKIENQRSCTNENRQNLRRFIDGNDYSSFNDAVKGTRMAEMINSQDKFELLVKAHLLREDGDYTGAREIMDKLGIVRGPTKFHENKR